MTSPQTRLISAAVKDLAYTAANVDAVVANLVLESGPLKGISYDGAGSSGSGVSDPTAAAALAPSKPRRDLDEINRLLRRIADDAATVAVLVAGHKPGDPKRLQRDLGRLAGQGEPGCELHARAGVWLVVHRRGTVGGVLDTKHALCRQCYDFVRGNGRMPTRKEVRAEIDTGRFRVLTTTRRTA